MVQNCDVTGFDVDKGIVRAVRTTKGDFAAEQYVLAGGAWTAGILKKLGIPMLLEAGKGYSLTIDAGSVQPRLPYIFSERRVAITPFKSQLRFAGTMELAGVDLSITRERVEAILDAVPLYFRNIPRPQARAGEVWAGLRPVTPDGMPYIGKYERFANLTVATGHAMVGISLATVTGKIVKELIMGEKPEHDLALLRPDRFN
jgi:D-amino-acid dehydrogenase